MLNRIARWEADAITYEADPRQAEKLILECGLEGCNSVATPGIKETSAQLAADIELEQNIHTAFRAAAARANYLAADRPDVQFSAKEVCRWMSSLTASAWAALKRLVRYLVGLPRLVFVFPDQEVDAVDAYADIDWAGCARARKSTSGGCLMLGQHALKTWSSTQPSVTLSSGEAEFNGVIRAAGIGLGYQSLLADLGLVVPLRVWTDSSAAIGVCSRQGLGKLRHLETHLLWIQLAVRSKRVDLRKIPGEENPADLYTKYLPSRDKVAQLVRLMGCRYLDGRAATAPVTRRTESGKATISSADLNEVHSEGEYHFPHITCKDNKSLDQSYPSVSVPTEVDDNNETMWDSWDQILLRGNEIIDEIRRKTEAEGRRRCELPQTTTTQCPTGTTAQCPTGSNPQPPPPPPRRPAGVSSK